MAAEAVLTGLLCVNHKAGIVEGGSLNETVTVSFDPTGITNLRLDHHDGDGTVDDMAAVLQDADPVFPHFPWNEGDT